MSASIPDQMISAVVEFARAGERIRAAMVQTSALVAAIDDAVAVAPAALPELHAALTAASQTADALQRAFQFVTAKYDTTVAA